MKVCPFNKNIQSSSRNLPRCSPFQGCLLRRKSIPALPWLGTTFLHSPATVQLLPQLQMHLVFSERTVSSGKEVSILVLVVGTP